MNVDGKQKSLQLNVFLMLASLFLKSFARIARSGIEKTSMLQNTLPT